MRTLDRGDDGATERPFRDVGEHVPLVDLLPLAGPLSVLVDPSSVCNLRCNYCPTGHPELAAGRLERGLMRREVFTRIVDGLREFPRKLNTLHLYKDGEPLLNPSLAWMVETARKGEVAESVELTTNGLILTRDRAAALIDAGLDRIRISLQPSSTGAKQDAKAAQLYARCLENVRTLREERDRRGASLEIHVKTIDFVGEDPLLASFRTDFGPLADTIHVDVAMGWSGAASIDLTLGSAPESNMTGQVALRPSRVVCPQPFYTLAINSNGEVSACCVDWSHDVVVGDVCQQSLGDIWRSEALRSLRLLHLDGRRGENRACRSCHYVQGASEQADLDRVRESLREHYRL